MTAHLSRDVKRGELHPTERERYVRWWVESSGLTERQLRKIATAIWAEHDVPVLRGELADREKVLRTAHLK